MSMLVGAVCATGARMVRSRATIATMYSAQVYASRFAHTEAAGKDTTESAEPVQQGTCMVYNETYEPS